jgi:hypothetical protein
VTLLSALGLVSFFALRAGSTGRPEGCSVISATGRYSLELAQAANAATISAVALREQLPDHAVTVALATALQESKLHDLTYGDRDSVGLFQQRPSQGWGPRADLLKPQFAAARFFSRLVQVPGWQTDAVATAAQAVQHSADGSAYQSWEPEARAIARALTGETAHSLTCTFAKAVSSSAGLKTAISSELTATTGSPVSIKTGWSLASWLVAEAAEYDIATVTFDGRRWTHTSGQWARLPTARTAVAYTLFR